MCVPSSPILRVLPRTTVDKLTTRLLAFARGPDVALNRATRHLSHLFSGVASGLGSTSENNGCFDSYRGFSVTSPSMVWNKSNLGLKVQLLTNTFEHRFSAWSHRGQFAEHAMLGQSRRFSKLLAERCLTVVDLFFDLFATVLKLSGKCLSTTRLGGGGTTRFESCQMVKSLTKSTHNKDMFRITMHVSSVIRTSGSGWNSHRSAYLAASYGHRWRTC